MSERKVSERSASERIVTFGDELFEALAARAQGSLRGRTNHNFHLGDEDPSQRFLNVLAKGTYVPPHKHTLPPKSEAFVVLRGEIAFFTFHDDGSLASATRLAAQSAHHPCGIDLLPGVWHSLAALSDIAVCYEVKPGPYAATGDKILASFAPREGDPAAGPYLEGLVRQLADFAPLALASRAE